MGKPEKPRQPLEIFEQEFICGIYQMAGREIYINPRLVENYALTQREAERLNNGKNGPWVGCSCGRLHYRDPETGNRDTGWN